MEPKNKELRSVRLQLAISLATDPDGDSRIKKELLQGICQADPWIREVLKTYGVYVRA
jgi:hypothetical protein